MVSDIDLTQLFDDFKSLAEGAMTVPGYTKGGWNYRLYSESGFVDPDKPIRKYTKKEMHDFLRADRAGRRSPGHQHDLRGRLILRIQKSFLSKDKEVMQPHIRAFVGPRRSPSPPVPDATAAGSARRPGRQRSREPASPMRARCRSATWPNGLRGVGQNQYVGLLGVVDTWLPELDEEQRLGLLRLTQALADQLGAGVMTLSGPEFFAPGDTIEVEEFPTDSSGIPVIDASEPESEAPVDEAPRPVPVRTVAVPTGTQEGGPEARAGVGLLDEVIENLPDGLVVTRDDGTIVFANASVGDLSGLLPEEILGKDITEILHSAREGGECPRLPPRRSVPGPAARARPRRRGVAGGAGTASGFPRAASSGTATWPCSARPPGPRGLGDKLQALLDALDEGIVVCDGEGIVMIANREAKNLQGLPVDEDLVGQPFPSPRRSAVRTAPR